MASSSPILLAPVSGSPSSSLPTQQEIQELLGTSPVPFASTGVFLPFGLRTPQQAGLLGSFGLQWSSGGRGQHLVPSAQRNSVAAAGDGNHAGRVSARPVCHDVDAGRLSRGYCYTS